MALMWWMPSSCTPGRLRPLDRRDRRAVRADLRPRRAELGGVEAEREDRVRALQLGLLRDALRRVVAALGQHLRHALELAADERLERCADLGAHVPRAHGEAEDLTVDLLDVIAREVVHGGDDHGANPPRPRSAGPPVDRGLQELRVMDLRDNALTALPRELGELQRLRTLDLRANPLRSLPDELAGLDALDKLDLRWTPFFPELPAPARALAGRGCVVLH